MGKVINPLYPPHFTPAGGLAELRDLATIAAPYCDDPWAVEARDCGQAGTLFAVVRYDAAAPDAAAERFDVFEDPTEAVAKYTAAVHPRVVLALLDEIDRLKAGK